MKVCAFEGELVTEISKAIATMQREGLLLITHIELTRSEYQLLGEELGGMVFAFPFGPTGIPLVVDGKRLEPPKVALPGSTHRMGFVPGDGR